MLSPPSQTDRASNIKSDIGLASACT